MGLDTGKIVAALPSVRHRGWMTPDRTAEEVEEALRAGDDLWAVKMVVQARDHVATMIRTGDEACAAWLVRSRTISDQRYDVLLAALIQHEFDRRQCRPAPAWTSNLRLETPWVLPNLRWGADWTREHTPVWLAKRGVYISSHDLSTA